MRCTPFHDPISGASGFICGSRRSAPKCSTPGCGKRADLECDAPVERNRVQDEPLPKRGEARLHRLHNVVFYVWSLARVEGIDHVTCQMPGKVTIDLKAAVGAWLSAEHDNFGIYLSTEGTDGSDFVTSEGRSEDRPRLKVVYVPR